MTDLGTGSIDAAYITKEEYEKKIKEYLHVLIEITLTLLLTK